jgi:hypothetical protein
VSLFVGLLVVLTKPADAQQQSTNSSVNCSNNLYCEACWNKNYSYITLGRGIESVKNSLQQQSGRCHVNTAAHESWAVWLASCQHSSTWIIGSLVGIMSTQQHVSLAVWQVSCWHSSTWIMASLAGIMLTQQHMDSGQSGRGHDTAAHGSSLQNTSWTSVAGSPA